MRIEMKVDWEGLAKPKTKKPKPTGLTLEPPRSRAGRRLWYIAVGREIEKDVASGRFASMAEAAQACGVSRARVSQLTQTPSAPFILIRTWTETKLVESFCGT